MDLNKKIEILRKRNAVLQDELDKNRQTKQRADKLCMELECIRKEWENELNELKKERQKYSELISELKKIREAY